MKALLCREFGPEANMNVEEIDAPAIDLFRASSAETWRYESSRMWCRACD